MPPSSEHRWLRVLGCYLLLLVLVGLVGTPIYLLTEPSNRAIVVRLATAVVLMVALLHLRGVARRQISAQAPSSFDRAMHGNPVEPHWAPLYVKLRDEVRFSMASQPYFANVLWPRLQALRARRLGRAPGTDPAMPAGRRWLRRGPSLATLRDLTGRIEAER
jgi:hypothetical protein